MTENKETTTAKDSDRFGSNIPIEIHLADHCNLNCSRCAHFSPVAEPRFATMGEIAVAAKTIRTIKPRRVNILGGEPLLHPDIDEIIGHIGENMPKETRIILVTNGILFRDMTDRFWELIKAYDIHVSLTIYPLKIDYGDLIAFAEGKGIELLGKYDPRLRFKAVRFSEDRSYDPRRAFFSCRSKCIQIRDGMLYPCAYSAYIEHINKRFGTKFSHSEGDCYRTDEITCGKDVEKWMMEPKPFCAYCSSGNEPELRWECSATSKIEEWVET